MWGADVGSGRSKLYLDPAHKNFLVGPYRVLEALGQGASGAVYRAEHTSSGERVALKSLMQRRPAALSRFKREFRALSELRHPNVVRMLELFEHQGQWLIAMELVEGTDFLGWVKHQQPTRSANDNSHAPPFDETRLRGALRGVAEGLHALHALGLVHRDLKPGNMRVTPAGRAVVLDFGLVTALDSEAQITDGAAVGTAAYMAPEQATGAHVTAAADWYALGTCLYEVLAGRLPFVGDNSLAVIMAKQGKLPAPPSSCVPDSGNVPEDLEALCMQLLEPEPEARGGADAVRSVLAQTGSAPASASTSGLWEERPSTGLSAAAPTLGVRLAGRDNELQFLWEVFNDSQQGQLRLALIEGESGIGKSALVDEFIRQLKSRHADALVLKGRCYENERVPYKAFDGCMDALTRTLKRIPDAEARILMPPRVGLLAQLFPVMADVPAIAGAPRAGISADPTARRLEAFAALCQLIHKLALDRPLVLVIDDLQWADTESFRLLRALVEDTNRPPVLVVFTTRAREELTGERADQVNAVRSYPCATVLELRALAPAGARELAAQLLGVGAPPSWTRTIAREGQGHPLFIDALVQYTHSHDLGASGNISLEAALAARIEGLSPRPRQLLELLALAARPHDQEVLAHALGAPVAEALGPLLDSKLARTRGNRQLVCFHDRLRKEVVNLIGTASLPGLHRSLALALAREPGSDPADRAFHWEHAGENDRARDAYEVAADAALQALAFGRAEQLYATALSLGHEAPRATILRLTEQRAHALARGGHSKEAATLYQEAAEQAEAEQRVHLGIHAAKHLLQSAQVEEGMQATRAVLAELDMALPEGERAAMSRLIWDRARIGLRGLALKPQSASGKAGPVQLQLEAAWQFSAPVAWVDVLPGANLSAAHLRRALDSGDPAHAARALAQEANMRAAMKPMSPGGYTPLLRTSRELADQVGEPALDAFVTWVEGLTAFFRQEHQDAADYFVRAERTLHEQCADEPWLLTNVRAILGATWAVLGEHRRLAQHCAGWMAQAREREDAFAHTALVGMGAGYTAHLMADEPDAALALVRETMAPWPREPFSSSSSGELLAVQAIETYRGGMGAHRWLEQERERLDRAFLLKAGTMQDALAAWRGNAALAAAVASTADRRPRLAKQVHRCAKRLASSDRPFLQAGGGLLRAQLHILEGQPERALKEARVAHGKLQKLGLGQRHTVGYLQGLLEGGDAGRAACAAAIDFHREQGWKDPERAIFAGIPALRLLEAPEAPPRRQGNRVLGGRFEILRSLGRGGYGSVSEARDQRTGRTVALKELTRSSPHALLRFKQEFRALQGLHHPRLARLDALFQDDGSWFIAMQLVVGSDLLDWVRPGGVADMDRVRGVFADLAEGLAALHESGFCHRDVKPPNVRVTPAGRVVLLDFGFIANPDADESTADDAAVGTAAYMAPEQRPGAEIAPEADLYAMGVCLYESLCGQLPFDGELPIHILQNKRRGIAPPPPSHRVVDHTVPNDLQTLALELLSAEPAARPTAAQVAQRLRPQLQPGQSWPAPHARRKGPRAFAGRARELATLEEAWDSVRDGHPELVVVQGDSGIGKSALVEHWLELARGRQPALVTLRGRCYENEQVPYNALDGVMDQLSRVLRLRPRDACEALLPRRAAVLAELFTVLGSVRAIGDAPKKGVLAEPNARRLQGFEALRALLCNLCRETPLVIAVDDLQWADIESFRLLRALLLEGESPPGLMLVATLRPDHELEPPLAQAVQELLSGVPSSRIALGPLSHDEAREVAGRMLGLRHDGSSALDGLVSQADGHPLFLAELAAFAADSGAPWADLGLTLDGAVDARVAALGLPERRLLQLVALAGRPYGLHVFARALSELSDTSSSLTVDEALGVLSAAQLIRVQRDQQLLCFHDRIRAAAARSIADQDLAQQQLALARALDGEPGVDPSEYARLWHQVGELERAGPAYEAAAQGALQALAFRRAEELYAQAIEVTPQDDADVRYRLTVQRAHALARGGRSRQAAALYQEAANHAQGDERVRLGIWAAQHLLQSAQVEQGMDAARTLLSEIGMALPTGNAAAMSRVLWDRTRIGLRGLRLKDPPEGGLGTQAQLQLEAAWQLSAPVTWVDVLPSANLSAAHLRRALDSGDPAHAARALAQEATMRVVQKPLALNQYEPLLTTSRELAEKVGDPALDAFVTWVEGLAATFRGKQLAACPLYERAERILREQCSDEPWLLTNVRSSLGVTWLSLGHHRTLVTESAAWIAQAEERDDAFGRTALVANACGYLRHLQADDPDAALAELRATMAPWPREPFSTASMGEVEAIAYIEGYRGGMGRHDWLEQDRDRLRRALLLKAPFMKSIMLLHRCNATLSAWAAADADRRVGLLAEFRKYATAFERSRVPVVSPIIPLLRAQVEVIHGRQEQALAEARNAREECDALGLCPHPSAFLEGLLEGGDGGRGRCDRAIAFFRDQGWVHPERAITMFIPILGDQGIRARLG